MLFFKNLASNFFALVAVALIGAATAHIAVPNPEYLVIAVPALVVMIDRIVVVTHGYKDTLKMYTALYGAAVVALVLGAHMSQMNSGTVSQVIMYLLALAVSIRCIQSAKLRTVTGSPV